MLKIDHNSQPSKKIYPFVLLILFPYLLIAIITTYFINYQLDANGYSILWEKNKNISIEFNRFVSERQIELNLISLLLQTKKTSQTEYLTSHLLKNSKYFESLYYFDKNQKLIQIFENKTANKLWLRNEDVSLEAVTNLIKNLKGESTLYISDEIIHQPKFDLPGHNEPLVYFVTKTKNQTGVVTGCLVAELRMIHILNIFHKSSSELDLSVVDTKGNYGFHTISSKIWEKYSGKHNLIRSDYSKHVVNQILSQKPGKLNIENDKFGISVPLRIDNAISYLNWTLILKTNKVSFWNYIWQFKLFLLIFLLALSFVVAIVGLVYSRYKKSEAKIQSMRNDFIAMLTHDLKSPLATIQMALNLGQKETIQEKRINKILTIGLQSAARMDSIIDSFLTLSKMESSNELDIESVDLYPFFDQIAKMIRLRCKEKNIVFNVSIDPKLTLYRFDRQKMERSIVNLLDNAYKYTDRNGRIDLKVHNSSNKLIISIKDTGRGIPEAMLSKIFQRYDQVNNFENKGVGLGLAIVQEIILAHNGSINVMSEYGKGSIFTITLPNYKQRVKDECERKTSVNAC